MEYKAIVSFSGLKLSMAKGQVREITDTALVDDLLKAGYIIPTKRADNPVDEEDRPKKKKK